MIRVKFTAYIMMYKVQNPRYKDVTLNAYTSARAKTRALNLLYYNRFKARVFACAEVYAFKVTSQQNSVN